MNATAEINVADAVAAVHQLLDSLVCDLTAVAQVHIMQVFAQPCDRMNSIISDVTAFGKNKIAQARGHRDDPIDGLIRQSNARCQVENPEVFVHPFGGQR